MINQSVYDSFMKAKTLLAEDKIKDCILLLLQIVQSFVREKEADSSISSYEELESVLILYSAALQRAQKAYRIGNIDYRENSRERTIIIQGILENIQAFTYTDKSKPLFSLPDERREIHVISISDAKLLARQLEELATNLEAES